MSLRGAAEPLSRAHVPGQAGPVRHGERPIGEDTVRTEEFRAAMRCWATGVTVVTTEGPEGPHGMTVNSLLSVSLDPPTLLISLARRSRTHRIVEQTGGFTVNVLTADQRSLADRFSGRRDAGGEEFSGLEFRPSSDGGGPELEDSVAVLSCRTARSVEVADHTLFIATVLRTRLPSGTGGPLIYAGRRYHQLGDWQKETP
ncbi:flavin reductase family protein [Streptomyces albipurpureus]|uniref:Flavin reductase family protein n=1 Tax=Streptomyces albipurpureus TaxID=2897419 RepID=A0ABT0UJK9_9ACTN|nr:flavin reductase family protein [Streptomyces sp. CWNU-1]MCM2388834.1 flavin reductase family protein [Streptomyces sp. CWNU-1]